MENPAFGSQTGVRMVELTDRQHDALMLKARGLGDKDACREMGITIDTFKGHTSAARRKLGISEGVSFCAVVLKAERLGLLGGVCV